MLSSHLYGISCVHRWAREKNPPSRDKYALAKSGETDRIDAYSGAPVQSEAGNVNG